jgi:phospholipid/cholesterol/gamma-HCH transport system substrate-binding protein
MPPPRQQRRGGRGETIQARQYGTNGQNGTYGSNGIGQRQSTPVSPGRARGPSVIARIAALGSLGAAIALIVLVLFSNGSTYTLRANFQDAGGLVTGDDVLIAGARVGSVSSIGLTPHGQAQVELALNSGVGPMRQGTVARVYQNSLSGIASKYVVLEPGSGPDIPSGGVIPQDHTYSQVNLDQLFNTLDPRTRAGLKALIRGEGAAIEGKGKAANRTLKYLAPGLASTSDVTAEIARDEPAFDSLLTSGATALQALASRSQELTALVANTNATTGAIAGQSHALQQALVLLPPTLNKTTNTFAGLRSTLDALDPLVATSKPAVRNLQPFAAELLSFVNAAVPTVGQLNALIHNPAGTGDLTTLALEAPGLAKVASMAFPRLIRSLNASQHQLDYLREYTPDVVGALTNLGQAGAYYDANGHYVRTAPVLGAFALNGANQLTTQFPSQRYQGLQVVRNRCPGGAVQPSPDGSTPQVVPGCSRSSSPPGP